MAASVAPDGTAYDLSGPEHAPVLALVHGLGLSRHVWDGLLPAFQTRYRVLRYDLHGHGASAPAGRELSLAVLADQLAGLLDHLDIPACSVIGFSIGGMINRRFALDHRDRLQSLVILNSPHDRGETAQQMVEDRAAQVREQGAFATFDAALRRWFTAAYLSGPDPRGAALAREWRGMADPESYAQATWVLANGVRELTGPARPYDVPTLVMTCENDSGSTPAMSAAIAADCLSSETVIVPQLQHLGLMEAPELFTAPILNFLERNLK